MDQGKNYDEYSDRKFIRNREGNASRGSQQKKQNIYPAPGNAKNAKNAKNQ